MSFLLFNSVISRVGATQAAVVLDLIAVLALTGATVFLDERVTRGDVLGAALVVSVVYPAVADHRAAARAHLARPGSPSAARRPG